jgi:hypothetical protein
MEEREVQSRQPQYETTAEYPWPNHEHVYATIGKAMPMMQTLKRRGMPTKDQS